MANKEHMIVLDTSSLMNNPELINNLKNDYSIIIPIMVVNELDNSKTSNNIEKACKARQAIRQLTLFKDELVFDLSCELIENLQGINEFTKNDDIIISCAFRHKAYFMTDDLNLKIKAEALGLKCVEDNKPSSREKGYKEINFSDEEMAYFYTHLNENIFGCVLNEYLIVKDSQGKTQDCLKWDGTKFTALSYRNFKSRLFGTIKPKDEYQQLAFDSIVNNDITLLFGKAGTGKTQIPLGYIMQELEKQQITTCYIAYHFETLKDAKTLGYVKGDLNTKLLQTSSIGNILSSKFGDISEVERLIASEQIRIIPTANIRGIECPPNSILYITEGQDLSVYALKTLIQRCKEGTKLIIEGDMIEQKDVALPMIGMERMVEVFKGTKDFGFVKLKNNYRGTNVELADLM